MSADTTSTVVIFHTSRETADRLLAPLLDLVEGISFDGAPPSESTSADIAIIHSGSDGWIETSQRLRALNPKLGLIVLAETLEQTATAMNTVHADRLVVDPTKLRPVVQGLLGRLAARGSHADHEQLERLVESRTALLQQIKSQWERSFDAVQDPMAVMDRDYRLIRVNLAYARHMGREIVDVPGRVCHQLRGESEYDYPRDEEGSQGICAGCPVAALRGAGGALATGRATLTDRGGRRWVISAHAVDIPDMPGSVVVHYRDVTEEVQRLAKMAKADKMSAVGELAGAVSHELNSPMTSILVFSEALARKTEEGSELHEHAAEINQSARRCRRLIQGLLRFARRPRGREMDSVRVSEVVEEILPLVQHRLIVAQIELKLELADDLWPIRAHIADLEHLLVDLMSNAIEACGSGDTITIAAKNLADEQLVELSVQDTGRGMPPEVLRSAFEPFFTTKGAGRAAGLGLTTCEAMVVDMGGTIELTSEPGQGTRAWMRLPSALVEGEA